VTGSAERSISRLSWVSPNRLEARVVYVGAEEPRWWRGVMIGVPAMGEADVLRPCLLVPLLCRCKDKVS
jgi:hypothetical protein